MTERSISWSYDEMIKSVERAKFHRKNIDGFNISQEQVVRNKILELRNLKVIFEHIKLIVEKRQKEID